MNGYVAAGYIALAVIIGAYTVYLRRRARILARALPAATSSPSPSPSPSPDRGVPG